MITTVKIKNLEVYGSTESLYDGTKKYRRVFDVAEARYINIEVLLYNLFFNNKDTYLEIKLQCFNCDTNEEICTINKPVQISKEDDIILVRDGWGTPEPGWWKAGEYKWLVYIENNLISEMFFYVLNKGLVTTTQNPYFFIQSIKLFSSGNDWLEPNKRNYFHSFCDKTTQYLNIELVLNNLCQELNDFPLELSGYIYSSSRYLKAKLYRFSHIRYHEPTINIDMGYGADVPGFWTKDTYTIEIIFMETLIAVTQFTVSDNDVPSTESLFFTPSYGTLNNLLPISKDVGTYLLHNSNENKLIPYKLKSYMIYGSLESFYEGKRIYRKVFDEAEVCYVNFELQLHNLQLETQDWTAKCLFKCIDEKGNKIAELNKDINAIKNQAIINLKDGWGTDKPGWWKKGKYIWQAYINNKFVADAPFFVMNRGIISTEQNPYFSIKTLRFFESGRDWIEKNQRQYLQVFNVKTARYLNIELLIENFCIADPLFPLELFCNVYNERRQLKAIFYYFEQITNQPKEIDITSGYGTPEPGWWRKGKYTVEIIFMEQIIGITSFEIDEQNIPFTGNSFEIKGLNSPMQTITNAIIQQSNSNNRGFYKTKELKAYGSMESLYQGARKYRYVYDQAECTYLNFEFSFYNIKFDEQEWKANIHIKCLNHITGEQICDLDKSMNVPKDQAIVYVRDGWGTTEVGWWKAGTYKWQVFIEETFINEVFFYVTDIGQVTLEHNPYFNITSIKFYDSGKDWTPKDHREYRKVFNQKNTHYINIEIIAENLLTERAHVPVEMYFNVYNESRQLKAVMQYFEHIYDHRTEIDISAGYGTPEPGWWYKGKYWVEMVLMERIIGIVSFEVGEQDIELDNEENVTNYKNLSQSYPDEYQKNAIDKAQTFEQAKAELEALVGLKQVKAQINEFATYLKFVNLRSQKGFNEKNDYNLHAVFMGNPGTGKTTVARMLGKIYKSLGLLSKGSVHDVGRAELVAEYIGQTAPKVKAAIEKARGGILFIDEAYALSSRGDDGKDFGKEVIEVLIKEMSDGKGDIAIICAGYTKEMQDFLLSNPGIASRFNRVIQFDDYTPDELMQIATYNEGKKSVKLTEGAQNVIYRNIVELYRNRDRTFGNARLINTIIEESKQNMALRLMNKLNVNELSNDELSTITLEDVVKVFDKRNKQIIVLPIDEPLLQSALAELNSLTGLNNLKKEVNDMVQLAKYYREINRNLNEALSSHIVFTGNPGTGKTTVARILVKIYKALGILERGQLIECDRQSLVAGFIGQTALKTATLIEMAIGGGLFIDEAYALAEGGNTDFGREAIEVLLKQMEDKRGQFMVIVAGYTDNMKRFLDSNPGLKSRFDKSFHFEDYSIDELMQIASVHYEKEMLKMDDSAKQFLQKYLSSLIQNKNKHFGNARVVRKIVEESTRKQHLRLAALPPEQRNIDMIHTITDADLQYLTIADDITEAKKIGF